MLTLRRLLLFAIFGFSLKFANAKEKVVHYSYNEVDEAHNLYVNAKSFSSSNHKAYLTTVTCPKYSKGSKFGESSERNCTVTSHTRLPERICPVTLKAHSESFRIAEYLEVLPFGTERAVILWGESNNEPIDILVRCTIVDLTTCQSKHLNLQTGYKWEDYIRALAQFTDYTIHNNTIEITIADARQQSVYINKYNIDAEGNFTSRIEPWSIRKMYSHFLHPIVTNLMIKSYIYKDYKYASSEVQWWLSKSNNSDVPLKYYVNERSVSISTTHNTIRLATARKSMLDVDQYTIDGKLISNKTFNYDFNVHDLAILNQADGAYILLIKACRDRQSVLCDYSNEGPIYRMLKVTSDGKIIGSPSIVETNPCHWDMQFHLFENEAKEACWAVLCRNARRFNYEFTTGKQFTELLIKCYTDGHFTDDI